MSVVSWSASPEYGTWWFGVFRWRIMLKAPWNEPLFSERYGFRKPILKFRGWRVLSFLAPEIKGK